MTETVSLRRIPAGALGVVRIGPDFDDPLPAEMQAAFEGRDDSGPDDYRLSNEPTSDG